MATHYDVLDARPDAPLEELRRSFHSVSRRHHPDLAAQRGETAAVEAEAMQRINEAWRILSDPALRRLYDAQLAGETRQPMPYQDEMALSEMEPFEDESGFEAECRCGGHYYLTKEDIESGCDVVPCDTCSLGVRILL